MIPFGTDGLTTKRGFGYIMEKAGACHLRALEIDPVYAEKYKQVAGMLRQSGSKIHASPLIV